MSLSVSMMENVEENDGLDDDKSWKCPVTTCKKSLSRKQTLQSHLLTIHGIGGK